MEAVSCQISRLQLKKTASLEEQIKSWQSEVKKWEGAAEAPSTKGSAEAVWSDFSEPVFEQASFRGDFSKHTKHEGPYTSTHTVHTHSGDAVGEGLS